MQRQFVRGLSAGGGEGMKVRQLALGNYPYPLYPFDCFLDDAVSLGIGNIELWAASPHMGLDDYSLEMAASLHRKIRSRGLQIICFTPEQCAYPINIGSEDEIIRTRSLRYSLGCVWYLNILRRLQPIWQFLQKNCSLFVMH
jgi:sugar phosphate isomerase/epimerase